MGTIDKAWLLLDHRASRRVICPAESSESRGLSSSSRAVKYHLQAPVPLSQTGTFRGFPLRGDSTPPDTSGDSASDQALELFERFRDGLESRTRLAIAGFNAVRQVLDKPAESATGSTIGNPLSAAV